MQEIINIDKNIFLYLNGLGSKPFDHFWLMISTTWIWVPLYIIFLYLIYKKYGIKNILYILIFIALGIAVSNQLSGIFKVGIMRFRPCQDTTLEGVMRVVKCGGKYGFYSAYASNTFFIATFLSFILRKNLPFIPLVLVFWALLVSYSHIYLGVHFPLDIVMGALVGFLLGGFFSTLTLNTLLKLRNYRTY